MDSTRVSSRPIGGASGQPGTFHDRRAFGRPDGFIRPSGGCCAAEATSCRLAMLDTVGAVAAHDDAVLNRTRGAMVIGATPVDPPAAQGADRGLPRVHAERPTSDHGSHGIETHCGRPCVSAWTRSVRAAHGLGAHEPPGLVRPTWPSGLHRDVAGISGTAAGVAAVPGRQRRSATACSRRERRGAASPLGSHGTQHRSDRHLHAAYDDGGSGAITQSATGWAVPRHKDGR